MRMKTISGHVRDVLDESEVALSAMQAGFLNLSAYAKTIQGEVSKRARREVAVGSIVVALSRYEIDVKHRVPLNPKVKLESIATRSALCELTFARTQSVRSQLRQIHENEQLLEADILTVTSGIREVSLILPSALKQDVLKVFKGQEPTLVLEQLASLTLRFPSKYLHTPNTIFALLRPLALNRINLVEVVSTYTELTVIVAEKNLQPAFSVLSKLPTV